MVQKIIGLSKLSSFKIVLLYAFVSAVYIYTSDYFLEIFTKDVELLSKLQTYKGIGFIIITSALLYILVKRNIDSTKDYYQQIIDVKKESDFQLEKSQEVYMTLFNHSPLPKWIFDVDTLNILLVNDAACSIYGYTHEEFSSMSLRDIRLAEDIPLLENIYSSSINQDQFDVPGIVRHLKKNGDIIYVKIKTSLITFEGKQVRLASTVDMTAEMEIRNHLMETNSKLKLAGEIANLGYWTNDLVNAKIQWSDEIYKIFELDPETFDLHMDAVKAMFHPEDQINFDPNVYSKFEDNAIKESEHRIITGTGKTKWILERQYLTKDKNNKPIKLEGIALDITKRKLHEQEIFESNERLKTLAQATVEAIIDWDIVNDTVMWGEGFHTMFGYDLSVYNNYLWSSNIHPEDKDKVLDDLHKILDDPTKLYFNAEFRFLKANGEVAYVQHKGIFIRDAKGRATRALAAMIDLTEVLSKIRRIEQQNKALEDISYTQSHIVRAPLANLLGLIALLKDNYENGIDNTETICHIKSSAEKLDGIIKDIVSKSSEVNKNQGIQYLK